LIVVGLLLGGLLQGSQFRDITKDVVAADRSTVMFLGLAILGYFLMFVGQLSFLRDLSGLFCGVCCPGKEGGRR